MAEIQTGCCEAKEAKEIAQCANERAFDLEAKVDSVFALATFAAVIAVVVFASFAYNADKTNERLQRLEKIVGMDEIGRRK